MGKTAEELKHELEQQRESVGRDLVAIGDRVSPGRMVERRKASVRQSVGRARDAVMGAKDSAVGTTSEGVSAAGASVSSAVSTVGDVVTGTPQVISAQTQGNPLAAGLIAFGVGALAGTLVPTTRREQQAVAQVQPALEAAAQDLGESAQVVAESAKEHAGEAAHHLKEQAEDAAASVKAEAQAATTQAPADPAVGDPTWRR
jgi:hypothetical protein